jgi:RNA polymerase sigma factor (sigma-70 family)
MAEKRQLRISLPYPKKDEPYTIEDVYREYYKPINRVLSIILRGNADWSEDLTHEVFVKMLEFYRNVGRPPDTPTLAGLLSEQVKRCYIDFKRDSGEADLRNYDDDPFVLFESVLDSKEEIFQDPEKIFLQDKRIQRMFDKIHLLKRIDRNILTLIFIDGITMRDTAVALNISYVNLRKRLQRARISLGQYEEEDSEVA